MEFLHPEFLYYMLPPLFILFALLLTQKGSEATFFSQDVLDKLRVSANMLTLKARNAIFMLIGVLMIIALAEPVIPEGKVEIKAKSADIMVALDISDSMLAEDVYPNRLKLAKQKILELLRLAPNERMGIIAFAKNSYLVSPLSFDHEAVSFLLRKLSTDSITEQGTDFGSMLEVVEKSTQKTSKKYLLIVSDGGDKKNFSKEIAYAKEKNISIFVLGVGTKSGAPIKLANGEFIKQNGEIIVSKLNADVKTLATKTGGVYIEAINASVDVKAMLREIEAHSKKKELKKEEIERFIPLFYFPLGLALLLLLIATSSMSKREKVQLPSAFLLVAFFGLQGELNAGLLDFAQLNKAKEAYEKGEYEKSAKIYSEYAQESKNAQSYYNAANALYKQGEYEKARKLYEKASFKTPQERANTLANIGNSYAKEPSEENLKSAIKAYENSLKLKDDKETKENLQAVTKALKKLKEEQKKQDSQEKDKKSQKNKDKKEQNKEKQESKEQQKNGDKSQNKDNEEQNKKKSDSQEQKKQEEQDKEKQNKEQKDKEQKKQEQKDKEQTQKQDENSTDKGAQELNDDVNTTQKSQETLSKQMDEMSESEEKKWLKLLNQNSGSYLYRLNEAKQENTDEKPW